MPEETSWRRDVAIAVAGLTVLLILPSLWPSTALIDFVIRIAALGLFATSLNLLIGYAGMVSFGHGMFFGLGAYSFGLMMQKLGTSIPVAFALTLAVNATVAAILGAISIRLKEVYFAFLTLAFQMLLYRLIVAWVPLTGGDQGLLGGIPRPAFFGVRLDEILHLYAFSCVLLIGGLLLMRHIVESPFGYTLRLIRDNTERATFLGIAVFQVKLIAFVIAGVFAGVGGMIMALFLSGAYPQLADWTTSGEGIFMIMLGGLSTFLGPLAGAVILSLLNDVVTRGTAHHGLALGAMILVFVLGLRKGLVDFILEKVRDLRTEHRIA
jgi:branched-chain amino acid transport system permease protein